MCYILDIKVLFPDKIPHNIHPPYINKEVLFHFENKHNMFTIFF